MARILVAEDDKAIREFVKRALSHRGHDVTAVDDGSQALEALREQEFDLLLADVVMPEMDGIALAQKVSRDRPDLPILLMSGYAAERQRAHGLDVLNHRVIPKPFTLKQICDATDGLLAAPSR